MLIDVNNIALYNKFTLDIEKLEKEVRQCRGEVPSYNEHNYGSLKEVYLHSDINKTLFFTCDSEDRKRYTDAC